MPPTFLRDSCLSIYRRQYKKEQNYKTALNFTTHATLINRINHELGTLSKEPVEYVVTNFGPVCCALLFDYSPLLLERPATACIWHSNNGDSGLSSFLNICKSQIEESSSQCESPVHSYPTLKQRLAVPSDPLGLAVSTSDLGCHF